MDYNELYKKAQKDLENVRVQKAQIEVKIEELVQELDLDKTKSIEEQVKTLKEDLETKRKFMVEELEGLANKLKELE